MEAPCVEARARVGAGRALIDALTVTLVAIVCQCSGNDFLAAATDPRSASVSSTSRHFPADGAS
jgi:hypothetical protein